MKKFKISMIVPVILLMVAGCDKNDSLQNYEAVVPGEGAGIKAMHLSPNAPAFNILVGDTKTIGVLSSTGTEGGFVYGNVFPSLAGGYALATPGAHQISAKVAASSSTLPGESIATEAATLELGKFYTVAVVDSLSNLDIVFVEDNLDVPDPTKAYYRIANFMMKGTADVQVTSSTISGYSFTKNGIAYKAVSDFDTLSPGTYKILLRANSTATRLDSITSFTPLAGRKYTLYTRGVVGLTGTNTRRPLIFQMTNW